MSHALMLPCISTQLASALTTVAGNLSQQDIIFFQESLQKPMVPRCNATGHHRAVIVSNASPNNEHGACSSLCGRLRPFVIPLPPQDKYGLDVAALLRLAAPPPHPGS